MYASGFLFTVGEEESRRDFLNHFSVVFFTDRAKCKQTIVWRTHGLLRQAARITSKPTSDFDFLNDGEWKGAVRLQLPVPVSCRRFVVVPVLANFLKSLRTDRPNMPSAVRFRSCIMKRLRL